MLDIQIGHAARYDQIISNDHFGVNFLFHKDKVGAGTFDDVVQNLGVTTIRYPGGSITERHFNLENPNNSSSDTVGLHDFLDYCQNDDLSMTFVMPTVRFLGPSSSLDAQGNRFDAIGADERALLTNFTKDLLSEAHIRGVEVTAIELGNEWYNDYPSLLASGMSPVEYGRLASKMAEIVQAAIDEFTAENSLPSHWIEPKILVQLGRMPQETAQIFEQFNTSGERSAIDGTLTHRYDAGPYEKIENSPGKNFSEFSHWDELIAANNPADFGDMSRFVTEWNIGAKNAHLDGLLLASAQLELFTHLIKADIDHANFWAVQQNNKTNLSGSEGRTDLKISGELFDLLNDSVVGKQLLAAESGRDDIEFTAFSGDGTYVIFLSSRSDETTTFKLDLSDLVGDFTHIEGTFLGVGDGQDPLSHRSDPQVTEASHSDLVANGEIYIALEAYEIVRLTVSTGDAGAVFEGGYSVDSIFGTHGDDEIFGYGGHDWLAGGLGSDKIWGGAGHDRIFAHNGSDRAFGGAGNDLLQMGAGHDKAWGGAGHDTLKGFKGNDLLVGQGGTDKLYGGPGKDIFVFNATDIFGQEEIMDFQPDEDSIVLRGINPNDLSFAVIGQDQLELSFLDTNVQGTILLHGQISTSDLVMGENLIVV